MIYRNLLLSILLSWLMILPAGAAAAEDGDRAGKGKNVGDVIDITGFLLLPRGDTRVGWSPPAPFDPTADISFGRMLKDEVLIPVDRDALRRRMEAERTRRW